MPSPLSRTLWTTKRGRIAAAAVSATALLVLTSCSLGDTSSTSTSAAAPGASAATSKASTAATGSTAASGGAAAGGDASGATVGFSAAVLDNPFTVQLVNSVVAEAGTQGLNMLPPTNAGGDPAKQVSDFDSLVTQGVQGIITIPADSDAVANAVASANAANIPVVTVDTAANGGKIYMNVRADNVAMGKSACEQIGKLTGDSGVVLELQGDLGTSSGADRHQGFADCMAASFPNVEIIAKPTDWKSAQAADQAQTVLSTTDVNAVFLASDAVMLDSVSNQMQNLSKWVPAGQDGHIGLVTIDGGANALAGIRGGQVDAVISQPINDYATFGVQYLQDAIAGKTQQVGPTDHNSQIVEYKGNLADLLPSPVVTTANVDDPDLWGNAAA